ncbi:MAG: hypothetical protein WC692_11265 [Erythrobacter sp.]
MKHSRFEAVRLRLEQFDPGSGWRLWLYELLLVSLVNPVREPPAQL